MTAIAFAFALSVLPRDLADLLSYAGKHAQRTLPPIPTTADIQPVPVDRTPLTLPTTIPSQPPPQTRSYSAPAGTPIPQSEAAVRIPAFTRTVETRPFLNLSNRDSSVTRALSLSTQVSDASSESSPPAPRRSRPASYHGRTSPQQAHSRAHSGGIRPLQLPIKVASAANSPKMSSDLALPEVDDTPKSVPATKTHFQLDDDVYNTSGAHSSFPEGSTSTVAAFAQAASRHRRMLSEQTFAQHERAALLARITELEQALHERQDHQNGELLHDNSIERSSYVEHHGVMSTAPTTTLEDDGCRSGYPSPPVSPSEVDGRTLVDAPVSKEAEDIHSLTVLEPGSPEKPRLQIVSPTLFTREKKYSSNGSQGRYFDSDVQAASPTMFE